MDGDANPVFIEISVSHFSIGTQELCVPTEVDLTAFKPACSSENLIFFEQYFEQIQYA